ncbi:MAG: hybrid sensor histidine kinase/response regulator [Myxococcales bacterium]|nr:MAG: hybrid sensor histidine kinase/response regulator [Myxococcales bacterium]
MNAATRGALGWSALGGEMPQRILSFDWSQTPLGPIESWPSSLKTTVAIMLHSRQPMFLWWGPELIQLYNDAYVPSFGLGKHPAALGQAGRECWGEIWPIIGPQIEDVLRLGKPCWFEDALVPILRNGKLEDVYWTYGYSAVFDEAGSIAGVLVICNETTSRVRAAEAQRRSAELLDHERQRLLRFFEQAPAGICLLRGPELVFDFANEYYRRLVGRADILGKPLLEALPELVGQGFDDLLQNVMASGDVFVGREVLAKLAREDGAPGLADVYVTFIYSATRDVSGAVDGVSVLALDVTQQVLARQEVEALAARLARSEGELRALAESMPQLAWSAQPNGFVDWYNGRWREYTGKEREELQGWGWQKVHDLAFVAEVTTRWQTALETGQNFEMEFPMRRADGEFRWHLTRAVPLRDEAGTITRWFGTNTDIDDAKRLEAERSGLLRTAQRDRANAETASRAKDEFLTTASHELRTPLNAILGWARLLRGGQLEASAYLRAVETIERNAQAQVRLIEDILDGSRIITGNLKLEIKQLDPAQLVQAALEAVRPAAEAKSISLTSELDPAAGRISGDPERLQQVVWNLCNNAIKFTPKGGSVAVRLRQEGTDVELEVADSGQGIAADFLPYVFERFRQAEGSTTRRHGGLGLGLALVRHLVEAHGGSVHAESEGVGRGATFRVRFPMQAVFTREPDTVRPPPPPSSPREQGAVDLSGVTVLVVDDEPDARDLLATVLRSSGAEVTTAASADEAMGELSTAWPTVLLSDVGMPGVDGYELLRTVRSVFGSAGAALPAIALTAYAREEDRRLAHAAGFNHHLAKPVDPADVLRMVAAAAAESQAAPQEPDPPALLRGSVAGKLKRLLEAEGVHAALRFLNNRTPHRYTGIYHFDGDMLRSLYLFDAEAPELERGDDSPLQATFCSIVGQTERVFASADTRRDARLEKHAARDQVLSYCGVLVRDGGGEPFGTLCHFDVVACDVPTEEVPLMDAASRLLTEWLSD